MAVAAFSRASCYCTSIRSTQACDSRISEARCLEPTWLWLPLKGPSKLSTVIGTKTGTASLICRMAPFFSKTKEGGLNILHVLVAKRSLSLWHVASALRLLPNAFPLRFGNPAGCAPPLSSSSPHRLQIAKCGNWRQTRHACTGSRANAAAAVQGCSSHSWGLSTFRIPIEWFSYKGSVHLAMIHGILKLVCLPLGPSRSLLLPAIV